MRKQCVVLTVVAAAVLVLPLAAFSQAAKKSSTASAKPSSPKDPPRSTYERSALRNPFLSPISTGLLDRLPTPRTSHEVSGVEQTEETRPQDLASLLTLEGVIVIGAERHAIINGKAVAEGQTAFMVARGIGFVVKVLRVEAEDRVEVEIDGKETATLKLRGGVLLEEPAEKKEQR